MFFLDGLKLRVAKKIHCILEYFKHRMLWFLIGSNILNTRLIGFDELVEGYNIINKRPVSHGMWIGSHPKISLMSILTLKKTGYFKNFLGDNSCDKSKQENIFESINFKHTHTFINRNGFLFLKRTAYLKIETRKCQPCWSANKSIRLNRVFNYYSRQFITLNLGKWT